MSLAPGEQRRLTEIECQLNESDPGLAAMFARFAVEGRQQRPMLMRPQSCPPERSGSRTRMIILCTVTVALIIACVVAVSSASRGSPQRGGHGPGVSPAGAYSRGPSGG
jgi:hypothetical protein